MITNMFCILDDKLPELLQVFDKHVRKAAFGALQALEPASLAKYAHALAGALPYCDWNEQVTGIEILGRLEPEALCGHAAVIAERLRHKEKELRRTSVLVLGKLALAQIAKHALALEEGLADAGGDDRIVECQVGTWKADSGAQNEGNCRVGHDL